MPLWRRFRQFHPLAQLALLLALVLAILSIDWQPRSPAGLPRVLEAGRASGELRVGAGRASLVPPFTVPIAGFDARPDEPFTGVLDAPSVRALTIEVDGRRVALVSLELVLVPPDLRERVLQAVSDLKLNELVLAATHTHSGPGGFWHNRLSGWLGIGSFDPKMEAFLVSQISTALHGAADGLRPAQFSTAVLEAANFASNRDDPKAPIDNRLTVGRFVGPEGQPLANLVIYAVHPTILPPDDDRLSGDWPGTLMASLEANQGAISLFFQGAVGDATWAKRRGEISRQERTVRFGQEIGSEARGALAAAGAGGRTLDLAWSRVELGLPSCDRSGSVSQPLTGAASNLFCWLAGIRTAQVSVVGLGSFRLGFVPGELVASLGLDWGRSLGLTPISLADGYVGAIEAPAALEAEQGERAHVWFGPSLAPRIRQALEMARQTMP